MPEPTSQFREFVEVCVEPLLEPLYASKTVAPNAIQKTVRVHLLTVLSDPNVRQDCLSKLLAVVNNEASSEDQESISLGTNVAEGFLQEFCRRLSKTTAAFIIHCMREAPDDPHKVTCHKYSQDDFDSLFSKQTLHNILGSTVKAVLRRCRQYAGDKRWNNILKVVLHRFAHIGVMEARPGEVTFWTALLARKAYTFVSELVLAFFVEIAKVMCYVETSSGSVPIKTVLKHVNSSPGLLAQWCDLVGGGLPDEEDGFFLMRFMITGLCRTFGRDVMLRRNNQEAERRKKSSGGVSSVGLRAQLTR